MSKKKLIIDPPSGWKYGYPREVPEGADLKEFLLANGYPEKMIQLALDHSRFWYEGEDEEDD